MPDLLHAIIDAEIGQAGDRKPLVTTGIDAGKRFRIEIDYRKGNAQKRRWVFVSTSSTVESSKRFWG